MTHNDNSAIKHYFRRDAGVEFHFAGQINGLGLALVQFVIFVFDLAAYFTGDGRDFLTIASWIIRPAP